MATQNFPTKRSATPLARAGVISDLSDESVSDWMGVLDAIFDEGPTRTKTQGTEVSGNRVSASAVTVEREPFVPGPRKHAQDHLQTAVGKVEPLCVTKAAVATEVLSERSPLTPLTSLAGPGSHEPVDSAELLEWNGPRTLRIVFAPSARRPLQLERSTGSILASGGMYAACDKTPVIDCRSAASFAGSATFRMAFRFFAFSVAVFFGCVSYAASGKLLAVAGPVWASFCSALR
jgi:hypothetical protein